MDFFDLYIKYEYAVAATQLTLAMLGMGATLTPSDFKEVVRDARAFSIGFVLQMLVVPLCAYGFIIGFSPIVGVAIGIAICAAIPGGTVSNIFTHFSRGHVALSIALTAVATLACLFTVPFVLELLIGDQLPGEVELPAGQIALEIFIFLLLPLAIGMLVLRLAPAIAPAFSIWSVRGSLFVILIIVVGALGAGRLDIEALGTNNFLLIIGFIGALAVISITVLRSFRLNWQDTAAINIEVVIRNTNLGLLIKASLFPAVVGVADPVGDLVLFTILLYGGAQLFMSPALIYFFRRQIAKS